MSVHCNGCVHLHAVPSANTTGEMDVKIICQFPTKSESFGKRFTHRRVEAVYQRSRENDWNHWLFWFTTFFYLTNFKLLNAASQRQLSLLCDSNSIQQMLRTWFCNLDRLKEMDVAVVVAVPRLGPKVLCWVTGIIRLLSTSVFDIRSILLKVLVSTAVPQEPNNNTFRP